MESLPSPSIVVLLAVLVAAGTDLWTFRIHNALTIPLFVTGLLYHGAAGGLSGLTGSVLGALVGGAPLLIPFLAGGMGAGDMKLMAGVGAWLGPWAALHVLIVSGVATGFYSMGLIVWNRQSGGARVGATLPKQHAQPSAASTGQTPELSAVLGRNDRRKKVVPFGAMVAIGVVVTTVWIGDQF